LVLAAIPDIPGLEAAGALTHIEALKLDYLPAHLVVLGGGLCRHRDGAGRRLGSRVTIVDRVGNLSSPGRTSRALSLTDCDGALCRCGTKGNLRSQPQSLEAKRVRDWKVTTSPERSEDEE
jgi:hypothetical protein